MPKTKLKVDKKKNAHDVDLTANNMGKSVLAGIGWYEPQNIHIEIDIKQHKLHAES